MRPLVLHYADDPRTYNLVDQYLWGRDILVAPVTAPDTESRKVYLPEGEWYDFWTNRKIKGGRTIVAASPLDTLPLFVRAGAIIPMGPDRMRTGGAFEELTLAIYPDEAGNASFTLYEDDGETVAYKQGNFALTTFTCEAEGEGYKVTIGAPSGSFKGQLAERAYNLALRTTKRPTTVTVGAVELTARRNAESLAKAADGWWFDQKAKVLHVKAGKTSGGLTVTIQ
jgi:alpha-glucosidase